MKRGDLITITRDWATYFKGERFRVVEVVDCANNTKNVRCIYVKADEMPTEEIMNDIRMWRTLPAEYCAEIPRVGSGTTVYANQGQRDATVLAALGCEVLLEYEMPAGKTFLRIEDLAGGHRSVSHNALPKKWRKELEA